MSELLTIKDQEIAELIRVTELFLGLSLALQAANGKGVDAILTELQRRRDFLARFTAFFAHGKHASPIEVLDRVAKKEFGGLHLLAQAALMSSATAYVFLKVVQVVWRAPSDSKAQTVDPSKISKLH